MIVFTNKNVVFCILSFAVFIFAHLEVFAQANSKKPTQDEINAIRLHQLKTQQEINQTREEYVQKLKHEEQLMAEKYRLEVQTKAAQELEFRRESEINKAKIIELAEKKQIENKIAQAAKKKALEAELETLLEKPAANKDSVYRSPTNDNHQINFGTVQKQIVKRDPNFVAPPAPKHCWVSAKEAHQKGKNTGLFMQFPDNGVKVLFSRPCD